MDRRQFLSAAATLPVLPELLDQASNQVAQSQPSYLFVLPDQLTWWMCDPAQRGALELPALDRLSAAGTNFERCYATGPVCQASRLALRTGRWPHVHDKQFLVHPIPTVEERMQGQGYRTLYVGKWHLSPDSEGQFVEPHNRPHWDRFVGHEFSHTASETFVDDDREARSTFPWDSQAMTDHALRLMRESVADEQPFFMQLNYLPPHQPYDAYPKWLDEYAVEDVTLRPNVPEGEQKARRKYAHYMNLVRAVDLELDRVLDAVDELEQDVVVIFSSDHGDMLLSQGEHQKRRPWEESARVPLIVSGPGWEPGSVSHPVGLVDLPATLCGLGQGLDLREARDSVYFEMARPASSWEDGTWRALATADGWKLAISEHGPRLLYDLGQDPYELANLAGSGHAREAELETRMREWAAATDDEFFA